MLVTTALSRVDDFKYLGVTLSSDFTLSKHVTSICNKIRKLIGMYHRKFYKYSNQETSLTLYKSIIRPHLEYASPVWSPHLVKDIKCIEDVRKPALRVCTKYWGSNYAIWTQCQTVATSHDYAYSLQ